MNFTILIPTVLIGFLAKRSTCQGENNFDRVSMRSLCCKKVKDLKDLTKATQERIEKNKVLAEVDEPLKDFLEAVKDVEAKWDTIKSFIKEDSEKSEKSVSEATKEVEKGEKPKESQKVITEEGFREKDLPKSFNYHVLRWVASYHFAGLMFSELDYMIVVAIGEKTNYKVIEKFISNYEIKPNAFFSAFSLSAVFIPLILVLYQII